MLFFFGLCYLVSWSSSINFLIRIMQNLSFKINEGRSSLPLNIMKSASRNG